MGSPAVTTCVDQSDITEDGKRVDRRRAMSKERGWEKPVASALGPMSSLFVGSGVSSQQPQCGHSRCRDQVVSDNIFEANRVHQDPSHCNSIILSLRVAYWR